MTLSARAKYRREHGTAPEHEMIRDMESHGELPTGKHAIGSIHRRHRQFVQAQNRKVASHPKEEAARQPDTKAPLFTRVKNAFARMLRR